MSKEWYPIIDFEKCNGCQACFNKCSRGVYAFENSMPKVIYEEGCKTGCYGCADLCTEKAISYFGECTDSISSCCQ